MFFLGTCKAEYNPFRFGRVAGESCEFLGNVLVHIYEKVNPEIVVENIPLILRGLSLNFQVVFMTILDFVRGKQ